MNSQTSANIRSPYKLTASAGLLPKLARSHNSAFKPIVKPLSPKALNKKLSWLHGGKKKSNLFPPFEMQGQSH